MAKKTTSIPVNSFGNDAGTSIFIDKLSFSELPNLEEWNQPERHDRHSFFLMEKGSITIEIDFRKHRIKSPSVIYMHPNQVHRILEFKTVTVSSWAIDDENLNPDYLELLESIVPASPLPLKKKTYALISDAIALCRKFSAREQDKLSRFMLKDSCNVLVALVISLYTEQAKPAEKLSRFETITKAFNEALENNYTTVKSPAAYAEKLNISTTYLNECVKNTTGHSVSHQIRQRVILEARRLLYHSGKSVKEIATALGYDDYPYFSRLFTKVTGTSALAFRNKNRD